MCGRIACTLSIDGFQKACQYQNKKGTIVKPKWKDQSNGGRTYKPSYNVCPTSITPVLVADKEHERSLQPMLWGMIPVWHKGKATSHGLSTNNCRMENILQSKLYKGPLKKGQRCVVVCDGFYEWQKAATKDTKKQPYFIYARQENGMKIDELSRFDSESEELWTGPRLLYIAAVFDIWQSPNENETIFSYSILTMESNSTLDWLHHRTPAVLDHETQIRGWIDLNLSPEEALALIAPPVELIWHMADNSLFQRRPKNLNESLEDVKKKGKLRSAAFMEGWLRRGQKRKNFE